MTRVDRTRAAAPPAPPTTQQFAPWPIVYGPDVPGVMSADALLDAPAGKDGFVRADRDHFYIGDTGRRLRLWGVNICFAGCFPTHADADAVANRLAHFGVNCVRFHHMDHFAWPRGIFADENMESLSPEALDRLDYFIAALKKHGIHANLNLHVSRDWARAHSWENAEKLPSYDKIVDLFHPDLIAAQKQYARDLLTHVNAYTKTRYADEPAVALVEINNENSFFTWGGEDTLRDLPEPYAGMLQKLWNDWLAKKYGTREKLAAAWSAGAAPAGPDLLGGFQKWTPEQHESAKMSVDRTDRSATLRIEQVDDTTWHLQFNRAGLKLNGGRFYSVRLRARSDRPVDVELGVTQNHDPWQNLGLDSTIHLTPEWSEHSFGFTCSSDDANARLSLVVGRTNARIELADARLTEGGQEGLRAAEDPAKGTVAR